ncbi:MAG: hypothetical protein JW751_02945 [Polyangiaceae bacterium]|nr:hypothetical protein [Polyangiaceae bacterium]
MNEPRRLIDGGTRTLARQLLEAGRAEHPTRSLTRRVLGLAASLAPAMTAGTAAASSSGLLMVKWLGMGAVTGLVVAGGVQVVKGPHGPSPTTSATAVAWIRGNPLPAVGQQPVSAPVFVEEPEPGVTEPTAISPEAVREGAGAEGAGLLPEPAFGRDQPASGSFPLLEEVAREPTDSAAEVSAREATIAEEIRLIDVARAALARRDGGNAQATLRQYRERFPRGRFVPETVALEVEAHLLDGNRAAAHTLAQAFLSQNPSSPLAERVRRLTSQ